MRFVVVISLLLLFLNTSCAGTGVAVDITLSGIQGRVSDGADIILFDGTGLNTIPVSNNTFSRAHGITTGYYGAFFIVKKGFYPVTVIFQAMDKPVKVDRVSLTPLKDAEKGALTGIVYKSVKGGKLKEHRGILQTFKGEKITLTGENFSRNIITDDNGMFTVELLPGAYDVFYNNKNTGKVTIDKGKTTIINVQKGMLLMD
ncbi:MAG: hypothetical protein C4526_05915 [Nitrospiraceae bacterium]|nr:MAG: hypothetical protein C4526_05915 [Nitrospiraceae bacterium]